MPPFTDVTYPVFVRAAAAIIETGFLKDLSSPMAKAAITFVDDCKDLPQACLQMCISALHTRIGTTDVEKTPMPGDIAPEDLVSTDVYKKPKSFLPLGELTI